MKYFDWDQLKNAVLKAEREICFEDIITAIDQEQLLDDIAHPNARQYPHQRLLIVQINNYAYVVPYVEDEVKIFFKTIIPSRKATRKYLKGDAP